MTTANGTIQAPDMAALIAERDRLLAENARLKTKGQRALSIKISETTGVVVVSGMRRFPTSLYKREWRQLADFMPTILAFLTENEAILTDDKD